jgi:O-methyltransferase
MTAKEFRTAFFHGVIDGEAFRDSGLALVRALKKPSNLFASDNLITFNKNLGFLDDEPLMTAWAAHAEQRHEKGILWRTATLLWAARQALRRDGAFVECGCYQGTTARILLAAANIERPFFLYDLFEAPSRPLPAHGSDLHAFVQARFAEFPNVTITKGSVPESLSNAPDQIAFLHIDMNNTQAELGALNTLFERVVPGGVVILDDYGWQLYHHQFLFERLWFEERGYSVLELPTGQGLVIR